MKTNLLLSLELKHILFFTLIPLLVDAQKLKYGQVFPQTNSAFGISVIHDSRSKMILPVGTYRIPNSSYFLLTPTNTTPMFGVVGVIVEDKYRTSKMKKVVSDETKLASINLDTITTKVVKEKLQFNSSHALLPERDKNTLTVKTCSWIITQKNKYIMTIEIEAYYFDEAGNKKWKGLYEYTVPDAKDLLVDGDTKEIKGEVLRQRIHEGINKCIDVLFKDVIIEGHQLQESSDDWIVKKQPMGKQGFVVKISHKNP